MSTLTLMSTPTGTDITTSTSPGTARRIPAARTVTLTTARGITTTPLRT